VGRIYIILQEKKGGHGGVNTNRSRSHPPQPHAAIVWRMPGWIRIIRIWL